MPADRAPGGNPCGAKPQAGFEGGQEERIRVRPVGGKDLALRGPWAIWEGFVDDRENEYLTLPLKGIDLGFYFGR